MANSQTQPSRTLLVLRRILVTQLIRQPFAASVKKFRGAATASSAREANLRKNLPIIAPDAASGGQTRELNRSFAEFQALSTGGVEPPIAAGFDQDHHHQGGKDKRDQGVQAIVED